VPATGSDAPSTSNGSAAIRLRPARAALTSPEDDPIMFEAPKDMHILLESRSSNESTSDTEEEEVKPSKRQRNSRADQVRRKLVGRTGKSKQQSCVPETSLMSHLKAFLKDSSSSSSEKASEKDSSVSG